MTKFANRRYDVDMTTMNISLTDDLKDFVERQVAERSFTSSSEYVRSVLRHARDAQALRDKLLQGSQGPWYPADHAYFDQLRTTAETRS